MKPYNNKLCVNSLKVYNTFFFGTDVHMTMDHDANSDVTMDRRLVNVTPFISLGFEDDKSIILRAPPCKVQY